MAKMWYPVIDILECAECGICVGKCPHGVYDKKRAPVPIVLHPEKCIDHCHGCGNLCPQGAIAYVGDDTGWKPPHLEEQGANEDMCCCCSTSSGKKAVIEYLYLDLNTCDRCCGTADILDDVVSVLRPALELAGYAVDYRKCEMTTIEIAEQYRFLSSPTIRVNGNDIFEKVQESDCGCCGEIAGVAVDCRVFEYEGKRYEIPTKEMLANLILKSLYTTPECSCGAYKLPENLKQFYEGKKKKAASECSCSCEGQILI